MTSYIVNLTNHLINVNHYDEIWKLRMDSHQFVRDTAADLSVGEVSKMSPSTLGKIMCSFEIGDVMARRSEILEHITFSGDCEDMLRELVSVCLAHAIAGRLEALRAPGVPAFRRPTISV